MAKLKAPVEKNDMIEVVIEDLGINGEGIGRYEGYTLFVDGGLPGEKVEVKVVKVGKNYGFAKLLHIEVPSPDRVDPKCQVARTCGGCQLQHMSYPAQLEFKTKKVREAIKRIGKLEDAVVNDIMGMEEPWYYRNKVSYPVRSEKGLTKIGFYAKNSHRVIEHSSCYIQESRNQLIVAAIKEWMHQFTITPYNEDNLSGMVRHIMIRYSKHLDKFHVTLVTNKKKLKHLPKLTEQLVALGFIDGISISLHLEKNNIILGETTEVIWGNGYLREMIDDYTYHISPKSFFQVNPIQTKVLYDQVRAMANLQSDETLMDLYCGIGTIGIYLAKNAKRTIGVEIVEEAIEDAYHNAELNKLEQMEFYVGPAEEMIPYLYEEKGITADVVVVDPPRKGCEVALLDTIIKMKPKRMVYVSCDPATLARDLKYMWENGYEVVEIQPVDMFPMTVHVETVCLLKRI